MVEQNIENREWKEQRLKNLRKRCTVTICINVVLVFLYSVLYLFCDWWIIFGGAIVTAAIIISSLKNIRAIQSYAQETMIYKLADESFSEEWNKYVTTVDFMLSKQYEEYNKKHKKE